ncbi:MAG: urate hydroxylase PuuD [Candidatus Binatia bacterium]
MEMYLFLLRWIHLLSGVTWIGLLYYFNLVQTPFFAETDPAVRSGAVQKLVPRALWWFRWGAMFTFLSGILIYLHRLGQLGWGGFFSTSYGWAITVGGLLGTLMFLNVWLVIWPKQKVVIASATQVAQGGQAIPEAAASARRAALASRTNTVFSIPMLFYMGAASHLTIFAQPPEGASLRMTIALIAILGFLELNTLIGSQGPTKKPLDSIAGALWSGFILTLLLHGLFLTFF